MRIPAGLEKSIEIFSNKDSELEVMMDGTIMNYFELPSIIREVFQTQLIIDKAAMHCLSQEMKIVDADKMEMKFVDCRYSCYKDKNDLEGHRTHPDAPSCKELRTCPGFNKVCKIPQGKNGMLSRQEYIITQLVSKGKQDKEISFELDIEISTIRTYLARIREKLCINNRIEIALWAVKNGIV